MAPGGRIWAARGQQGIASVSGPQREHAVYQPTLQAVCCLAADYLPVADDIIVAAVVLQTQISPLCTRATLSCIACNGVKYRSLCRLDAEEHSKLCFTSHIADCKL